MSKNCLNNAINAYKINKEGLGMMEEAEKKTEGLRARFGRACRTFRKWAWWFVIGTFMEKRVAAIRKEAWDMNDNVMPTQIGRASCRERV